MIKRVNELLDVSMIEEGKWEDLAVLTDVMPIIEDAVKEVSIDATVKNINIILKAPTTPLAQIVVGKKRFEQAIITILSNAIKFNQQDGKVTIDFRQDNKKLQIIITDTGIGIPRDDQSKIFSKFFRAKNALLTETEGTGLGLFIIKSYIEKWGGKISLKSQEGKYTTYYLEFQIP
jgi:two-component system phosphate regulon sensor histidine kinase PhoR